VGSLLYEFVEQLARAIRPGSARLPQALSSAPRLFRSTILKSLFSGTTAANGSLSMFSTTRAPQMRSDTSPAGVVEPLDVAIKVSVE
jgi:hypothetical protein